MRSYKVWIRLSDTMTATTVVHAQSALEAKLLAEQQYGVENVFGWPDELM
jgi:hypothetical protein